MNKKNVKKIKEIMAKKTMRKAIGVAGVMHLYQELGETLDSASGAIILLSLDKMKIHDYYQGVCVEHLIKIIKGSAEDFAKRFKTIKVKKVGKTKDVKLITKI